MMMVWMAVRGKAERAPSGGPWIASSQGLLAMTVNVVFAFPESTFLFLGFTNSIVLRERLRST